MRIGFNLLAVGGVIGEGHAGVLESARRLGYDGVEVPVFEGALEGYAALGRRLADLGLAATIVTVLGEDVSPVSADPAVRARARDRLRWAIDRAHALGATVMCGPYHSPIGAFSGAGPTADELARCADAMRDAAAYGQDAGVHLAVEALNRFECYLLNTAEQAAALKARVGHPNFAAMFDTFHANIEERDPVGAYRAHAAGITHIHVSENDRGIPGRGHVPFADHFAAIRASGYDSWLTVEAFGRALPELAAATRVWRDLFPDLETLMRESLELIRREWERAAPA